MTLLTLMGPHGVGRCYSCCELHTERGLGIFPGAGRFHAIKRLPRHTRKMRGQGREEEKSQARRGSSERQLSGHPRREPACCHDDALLHSTQE